MLVVADTSPLIVLTNIGQNSVLPALWGDVIVPPAVAAELALSRRPAAVRNLIASPPSWLRVHRPIAVPTIAHLHLGEVEAIGLALELRADLLLVDDRAAFREAVARQINAIGTVRVLEIAADQGLVDLHQAFDALRATDFWISPKLLDQRLKAFQARRPGSELPDGKTL